MLKVYLKFIMLLVSLFVFQVEILAETRTDPKLAKDKKTSDVYGDVVVDESIKKLLEVKGVDSIFKECKSTINELKEMPDCIWKEVQKDPQMKKEVLAIYSSEIEPKKSQDDKDLEKASRAPADERTGSTEKKRKETLLTSREKTVGLDFNSDPAVKALSDFYGKKLDEILKPSGEDAKANKIVSVDHKKFIELYQSELGRSIVNAFTSYCLDTSKDSCDNVCTISSDKDTREADRKANLASISGGNINFDTNSADGKRWTKCITDVPKVCYEKDSKTGYGEESIKRACLIMDYVKSARKNLLVVDEQMEYYQTLNNGTTIAQNLKMIDPKKLSSDSVLEITSNDIDKSAKNGPSSFKEENDKLLKEADACIKDNKIIDSEVCKKFISLNKDTNENAVTEFGIRQFAQEDLLKEKLSADDKVLDYLKEEGYSDEQIKTMASDKTKIQSVREEILHRYQREKEAIIADMAERIEKKTAKENGKIEASDSKLDIIRNDLASRTDDLKNLIRFNNVVSSYLSLTNDKKETSRNVASLLAETKTFSDKERKAIEEKISKSGITKDQKDSGAVSLEVKTINDNFLKYSTQPKEADKKN